jgi:hypothetical protein
VARLAANLDRPKTILTGFWAPESKVYLLGRTGLKTLLLSA